MPPRKKQPVEPAIEPTLEPVIQPEESPEVTPPLIQEDTVTFKRSHFYAVLTVLAFAAGVLLGYVVWGVGSPAGGETAQTANPSSNAAAQAEIKRYDIPTENAYFLGPADAPITIVDG